MVSEENVVSESKKNEDASRKASLAKAIMAYASIIIGIVGLSLYFSPIAEILCGGGGLVLSILAKDINASWFTSAVRKYGNYAAWLNIIWVCAEFGLKFAGINLF